MSFEENIKKWVALDNNIKHINERVKELRTNKSELEGSIQHYLDINNIDNPTIEITDGKLKVGVNKVQSPLTYKYIEQCLFNTIRNEDHVSKIMTYIKENRDIKIEKTIKRTYNKN